ncbi:MAG: hypothetical protein RB191_02205 [Terriglobia bacterium]|nr:hypothetical protein [Terriglobia bacterium]
MKNPVPYRVECRWPVNSWFEVIAAFDVERVALQYAQDCAASTHMEYRVTYRGKVLHEVLEVKQ